MDNFITVNKYRFCISVIKKINIGHSLVSNIMRHMILCVFVCSGCCGDRNGSLVEGEDLGGASVKIKLTIHIN